MVDCDAKDNNNQAKSPKKQRILPQSVIDFYSKFRNPNPLKVSNIVGNRFELEERYEILDSSTIR